MIGVITVPQKIITGAFTILISSTGHIELTAADIDVETLEGDPLGHDKDSFGGSGTHYHILCYLPDMRKGVSRISIKKEGLSVEPVVVEYDTINLVIPAWGKPFVRGKKIEVPLILDTAVQILRKRNFRLSRPLPMQIYGSGNSYSLVLPRRGLGTEVTIYGTVRKQNGVGAMIHPSTLEI